jgi:hypothetical protein
MLRHAKTLERCELRARDGKIGHVRDFHFDDRQWTVRYLVVDTGTWLDRREVLISPVALGVADWEQHLLPVDLTMAQVRRSPALDTTKPVTPEQELALTQYYNWPAYWSAGGFPDIGLAPLMMPVPPALFAPRPRRATAGAVEEEHHLRSVRDVTGYPLEAIDGAIGHVDDFLIDDCTWEIRYLVAATGNWLPGKKVILAPQWIHEVGWEEPRVYVDLTRATIKGSPAYHAGEAVTPDYAGQLHDYYGRPRHPGL